MTRVLLLNSTGEPLLVVNHRKAMSLILRGRAEQVATYDDRFILWTTPIPMPSVLRLTKFVRHRPRRRKPSRRLIFLRDAYSCGYCGCELTADSATIDHVLPRSRGGRNTWANLVTCCGRCNRHKADRTPAEAGMEMIADLDAMPWEWQRSPELDWLPYLK